MNVSEAIATRRAIKHFDASYVMPDADAQQLLTHAMLAPTAFNIQHWRFVHVQDNALRQEVRQLAWNQAQVTEASMLLILCADLKAWEKTPTRYWRNAPQGVQDFMVPAIGQYYAEHAQVQRDEAMRSCGIAAMSLMLLAREMGYDSCPMDGFDFDAVGRLIRLPDDHVVTMMLAIGKASEPAWPRGGQLDMNEVVIKDRFPG